MHIAKFIEEQKRLNPEAKYWFQRKSPLYERVMFSLAAIFGMALAIYMPLRFASAPSEVIGHSYGFALGITITMTIVGLNFLFIGGLAAFRAFRKHEDGVSHLQAIIMFIVIAVLSFLFSHVTHTIFVRGNQLDQESKLLQSEINQR